MVSLPVHDVAGQNVGSYEFDPAEFAAEINKQLLHDVVVMYEANRRVGSVRTKSRGDVTGSTKKLYRQKGTGRARMGANRTAVRRGGGRAFARVPTDWSYRLPKKAVRKANRMALASKFLDGETTILEELRIEEPRTKVVQHMLEALELAGTTCLLTIEAYDRVIWKSARNIPGVLVSPADELNAYDLLRQRQLVITKPALDRLRNQVAAPATVGS